MPKKTRQEKILARLRRLENSQEQASVSTTANNNPTISEPQKVSFEFQSETKKQVTNPTASVSLDYSYVYKDLTKSLAFAAVAIIFQVILALFVIN